MRMWSNSRAPRRTAHATRCVSSHVAAAFVVRRRRWCVQCVQWTDAEPPSVRLLCSGRHTLGRKEGAVDLLVPIFRVSRLAGVIVVSDVAAADAADPATRAQVTWTMQANSKSGNVVEGYRGRNRVEQRVRVDTPTLLQDGSRVWLVPGVYAELQWKPLVISALRMPSLDTDDVRARAASMGVHIVSSQQGLDSATTHLCVPAVRPNKTQLLALVRGVPLVSEAFVHAVLASADTVAPWTLPDANAFLPPLDARLGTDAVLPAEQLRPDTRRATLFADTSMALVLPRRERRFSDLAELAQAAGAHVRMYDTSTKRLDTPGADALISDLRAAAAEHWAAEGHAGRLFVLCDDDNACPILEKAAAAHGVAFIPQGTAAISECVLEVQGLEALCATPASNDVRVECETLEDPRLHESSDSESIESERHTVTWEEFAADSRRSTRSALHEPLPSSEHRNMGGTVVQETSSISSPVTTCFCRDDNEVIQDALRDCERASNTAEGGNALRSVLAASPAPPSRASFPQRRKPINADVLISMADESGHPGTQIPPTPPGHWAAVAGSAVPSAVHTSPCGSCVSPTLPLPPSASCIEPTSDAVIDLTADDSDAVDLRADGRTVTDKHVSLRRNTDTEMPTVTTQGTEEAIRPHAQSDNLPFTQKSPLSGAQSDELLPSSPLSCDMPPRSASPADLAPPSETPAPTLRRRAGTRAARRSLLMDELMGVSQEPPVAQTKEPLARRPWERASSKYRDMLDNAPPDAPDTQINTLSDTQQFALLDTSTTHALGEASHGAAPPRVARGAAVSAAMRQDAIDSALVRPSLFQVRLVPMVRHKRPTDLTIAAPNYKKFRRTRRATPHRVQLVSGAIEPPASDELFFGEGE